MSQIWSSKGERRAAIAISVVVVVGVIAFSIWSRTWFAIVAYVIFIAIPCTFSLLRSRTGGEPEFMDRIMKAKDDPKEMARWVP
jgi:hypothetical protein